jgi:hypothetical protein
VLQQRSRVAVPLLQRVFLCPPLLVASGVSTRQALVSVSVIGTQDQMSDEQLAAAVVQELSAWFGADETSSWSHLRTYRCVLSAVCVC